MQSTRKYYDILPFLETYKKYPIKISCGGRGIGKTFNVINYEMNECLKSNLPLVYVVENDDHIKELKQSNYEGITNNFCHPDYPEVQKFWDEVSRTNSLVVKGRHLYVDGKLRIILLACSQFAKYKKMKFPEVQSVLFEEFLPERVTAISNRIPKQFMSIMQTVLRTSKCNIWLLGNIATLFTSYNVAFALGFNHTRTYGYFTLEPYAVMHLVDGDEYEISKEKDESLTGWISDRIDPTQDRNILYSNPLLVDEDFIFLEEDKFEPRYCLDWEDYFICFVEYKGEWYASSTFKYPNCKEYAMKKMTKGKTKIPQELRNQLYSRYRNSKIKLLDMNVESLISIMNGEGR